jgi:hypothetical protein
MKPGDHPDFYRLAPPPGTSRESTIVLDRAGRFWHDGERVEHPALEEALRTWIARHPDDGRPILTNGWDWCYFRAEDAPCFVDALRVEPGGSVTLRLFDGSEETLDPATLALGTDGVVYARAKGGLEARFSRHAQTQLAPLLQESDPPTVVIQGRSVVLPPRGSGPACARGLAAQSS